ncbi:hypothetical protein FHX42_004629 [Saccharopolyspora lacisalsi]|uniref:Uncharacterized protein n=1 Tax=Halosaccharopolyspora lacisalsi TaxID=1000566 RepID=A0A839E5V3_9PSEU|nr:hypothetical protein [Halosaccharopolyspora lacisalsi]MBA8827245.1 hypothetical protein [Halosaccharopolyspora lacisalsi]
MPRQRGVPPRAVGFYVEVVLNDAEAELVRTAVDATADGSADRGALLSALNQHYPGIRTTPTSSSCTSPSSKTSDHGSRRNVSLKAPTACSVAA